MKTHVSVMFNNLQGFFIKSKVQVRTSALFVHN